MDQRCQTLKYVLALNPEYGVPITGYPGLRKMRVQVPGARLGKRGGYRCIYQRARIDEIEYVVFLDVYYKGDTSDLTSGQYRALRAEAEAVLADPLDIEWEDALT